MKRLLVFLASVLATLGLLVSGCGQGAPAPTPTKVPVADPAKAAEPTKAPTVAPTKAVEPTKASAAQPTDAPGKKVTFPASGKTVTMIVPYPAGGATDIAARALATEMAKVLGSNIEVLNKPGASAQVGLTELALAKPDGYTIGYTPNPASITSYLDPERKAAYTRKSFQQVATQYTLSLMVSVEANSPYKSMRDVVEAAKANPEKVKAGTAGIMATAHVGLLQLQQVSGAKFAIVHFDGGAPQLTALAGGHIDVATNSVPEVLPYFKSGKVRILGVMDREETKFFPGVKPLEAQGYKVQASTVGGISVPAQTPREIVDILSAAAKKAMETEEHKKRMDAMGYSQYYSDADQYSKLWDELEAQIAPLMRLAKEQQK